MSSERSASATMQRPGRNSQPIVNVDTAALRGILSDFSLKNVWSHLKWLNDNAPARLPGSQDQDRAAEYFVDRLETHGLNAQLEWFTAYASVPTDAAFTVTSPVDLELPCTAFGYISSTPEEGLNVDLVNVGVGSETEYVGRNVTGSAVIVEMASGPSRSEKASIAARHGARAIIFVNWGDPANDIAPFGTIKYVTGNPTRSMLEGIPEIAAIGVSRATGDRLIQLLQEGSVSARIVARATRNWGPLSQAWGRLRAAGNRSGDFLVVGGHFDAWEPGMTDNGAGNALMLELARVFSARQESIRRDIVFCFWNGHEIGHCEGATWFADRYWDDLDANAVAYFNVDSVGIAQSSVYRASSTPELKSFHRGIEQEILGVETEHTHLRRGNEYPFYGLGLPALEGHFHLSPEQIAEWGGARKGWWWHTREDTIDKIDRDRLRDTAMVYARYIWDMCTPAVLPMDFSPMADHIARNVMEMQTRGAGRFELDLPVDALSQSVATLAEFRRSVQDERDTDRLNRTLKRLSRLLLPAFETVGGRHGPDHLTVEELNSPIPAIHAMQELRKTPPDAEKAHLMYTELLRRRNRLSDALRWASREIEELVG